MKKLILFLLLLPIVFASTLQKDQVLDFNNHEIKIIGIQESKVLVSVDGVSNIFSLNEEKIINGVSITLTNIFYADELSTADLDLELTYDCGDKKCDSFESFTTCCQDCGCNPSTTEKCVDNECIQPECTKDINCNDNNSLTTDTCSDYKCKFTKIKCKANTDCNDNNLDTDDICDKGNCKNILNYVCKLDEDCNDDNPCTIDKCINKDCSYEKKTDCEFKKEEKKETPNVDNTLIEEKTEVKKGFLSRFFGWIFNLF